MERCSRFLPLICIIGCLDCGVVGDLTNKAMASNPECFYDLIAQMLRSVEEAAALDGAGMSYIDSHLKLSALSFQILFCTY